METLGIRLVVSDRKAMYEKLMAGADRFARVPANANDQVLHDLIRDHLGIGDRTMAVSADYEVADLIDDVHVVISPFYKSSVGEEVYFETEFHAQDAETSYQIVRRRRRLIESLRNRNLNITNDTSSNPHSFSIVTSDGNVTAVTLGYESRSNHLTHINSSRDEQTQDIEDFLDEEFGTHSPNAARLGWEIVREGKLKTGNDFIVSSRCEASRFEEFEQGLETYQNVVHAVFDSVYEVFDRTPPNVPILL